MERWHQTKLSAAAKVLSEHPNLFIDLSENAKTAEVMVEKEDNEKEKVLEMNIDELELSVRSYNCLKRSRNQYSGGAVQPHTGRYDESQKSGPQIPGRGSCKTERIRPAAQPERRGLKIPRGGRALQCVPFMQIRGRVKSEWHRSLHNHQTIIFLYSRHSSKSKGHECRLPQMEEKESWQDIENLEELPVRESNAAQPGNRTVIQRQDRYH